MFKCLSLFFWIFFSLLIVFISQYRLYCMLEGVENHLPSLAMGLYHVLVNAAFFPPLNQDAFPLLSSLPFLSHPTNLWHMWLCSIIEIWSLTPTMKHSYVLVVRLCTCYAWMIPMMRLVVRMMAYLFNSVFKTKDLAGLFDFEFVCMDWILLNPWLRHEPFLLWKQHSCTFSYSSVFLDPPLNSPSCPISFLSLSLQPFCMHERRRQTLFNVLHLSNSRDKRMKIG